MLCEVGADRGVLVYGVAILIDPGRPVVLILGLLDSFDAEVVATLTGPG